MPHFEDIEPEDEKEPLPALGGARFYTWDEISSEYLNPLAQEREEEKELPPLIQVVPEAGVEVPPAPSGQPPKRKIEGSIALPQPLAEQAQRHAEEQDKHLTISDDIDQQDKEELAQTLEDGNTFPSSGGGGYFLPPLIIHWIVFLKKMMKKTNLIKPKKNLRVQKTTTDRQKSRQDLFVLRKKQICVMNHHLQKGKRSFLKQRRTSSHNQYLFKGITPQEDFPPGDELTDWYDDTSPSDARASTDVSPMPKAKAKAIVRRERSPRNLRNRQVARSIRTEERVNWNLQAQKREFERP